MLVWLLFEFWKLSLGVGFVLSVNLGLRSCLRFEVGLRCNSAFGCRFGDLFGL